MNKSDSQQKTTTAIKSIEEVTSGPYNTLNTVKHRHEESKGRSVEKSHIADPTISSASKQKEPVKRQPKGTKFKQSSVQKPVPDVVLNKSKPESKRDVKNKTKQSTDEDKGPFGSNDTTQQDIRTAKRHSAQESMGSGLDQQKSHQKSPRQDDDQKEEEEEEEDKPSPTKRKRNSKKSTSKKSATSNKSIEPKHNTPNQDLMDSELDVSKPLPTPEELPLPVQDGPKQLQLHQQPQLSPKSTPSVRSVQDSQSSATIRPSEQNPVQRRPRPESDTDQQLPGAKKVKKVKDVSDTAIIASSRHVLKPIQKDISLADLKALTLVMLQNETFQKKCEWAFLSNAEASVWLCHRELTIGNAKRFGFTREEMPERERQCRLSTLQGETTQEIFGFEELYLNTNLVAVKEKRNEKRRTKTATPENAAAITATAVTSATQSQPQSHSKTQVTGMGNFGFGEQSLLSGITGLDITTVRSSEMGDHTPIESQKLLHIPLTMRFLDSTILDFLYSLLRDHWTVEQLKVKFLRSGHDPIFQTILNHHAKLRIYEEGVADTNTIKWLTESEYERITQLKADRDEEVRAMPKLPITYKIDDVLAEAGFGSN